MNLLRGSRQAALLLATSIAGMISAHALVYWLVVPAGSHRHELLLQTGHGYWPQAVSIAIVAAFVAALASIVAGYTRARHPVVPDLLPLAIVQAGGFVALEAVERIGAGPAAGSFLEPLMLVGVVVQILVAAVAVPLMRALQRAGSALRAPRAHPVGPGAVRRLQMPVEPWLAPRLTRPAPARAPPALAL